MGLTEMEMKNIIDRHLIFIVTVFPPLSTAIPAVTPHLYGTILAVLSHFLYAVIAGNPRLPRYYRRPLYRVPLISASECERALRSSSVQLLFNTLFVKTEFARRA